MRFSIIVPVYRTEEYLSRCVDSLLCQNHDSFEIILVDDGSPDKCPQICDFLAETHNRIKVVHKNNGGLSDARNAGISEASGDYLCFVDSDDYWDDADALSYIEDVLSNATADVIQFGYKKYWQNEKKIEPPTKRDTALLNSLPYERAMLEAVSRDILSISACSMVVSRLFLKKNDLYFKKGIKSEDIEWAFRLFLCKPQMSFLDNSFYIYRMQRKGSITSTIDYAHLLDYCDILETAITAIEKAPYELRYSLMSYAMYHVVIASAHSENVLMSKAQKTHIQKRLSELCKQRLLKNTVNGKVKIAATVYRFFGYKGMAHVLGIYLRNRMH